MNTGLPPAELVEANLLALFRHFANSRPSGEVRELPGVSIASSGVSFHLFNTAFFADAVPAAAGQLERRIALAAVHFQARGLGWSCWAAEHKLPASPRRVRAAFLSQRMSLSSRLPGMLARGAAPPRCSLPALEVRPVLGEVERLAFIHVNAAAFQVPFEACSDLYGPADLWNAAFFGYVGYAGGQPVATAAILNAAGTAGVYCVATVPEHQRRGCAEVMVRHALDRAREECGLETTVLESTAAGLSLYRRMGYKTVTHFQVYTK